MPQRLLCCAAAAMAATAYGQMCMAPPTPTKVVAYPSGTIVPNVGTSDIPISTESEKCRALVRNGFALVHCFWFNEAIRVFQDAVKEDPSCAIAWCGLHVSLVQPWFDFQSSNAEAEFAIQRAVAQSGAAGDLEQGLIAAFRVRSSKDPAAAAKWEAAMERLIERNPKAVEPRLLLAGIKAQLCMGTSYDDQGNKAGELNQLRRLVEPLLPRGKDYPGVYHYYIHAVEGSEPDLAVPAADLLSRHARGSAHMVHMPGHIYNRVGQYVKGEKSFGDAKAIEEAHAKALSVHPSQASWNYGHNVAYLSYNLVEMGKVEEALALADNRFGRQLVFWRAGRFEDLIQQVSPTDTSSTARYFRGMAAVDRGDLALASQEWLALRRQADERWKTPPPRGMLTDAHVVRCQELELGGYLMSRKGHSEAGLAMLAEAVERFAKIAYEEPPYYARPPHETLGAELIRLGRNREAEAVYRSGLVERRNSPWMLQGIQRARRG